MSITVWESDPDAEYERLLTGTTELTPATAVVSSKSFKTVRDAIQDASLKGQILESWKQVVETLDAGAFTGTREGGNDVVSAILEHPKIILEHEDFVGVKLNPYFKQVQSLKLPFPKVVVITGAPLDVSSFISEAGYSPDQMDMGEGNLNMFFYLIAIQHNEHVIIFVPMRDKAGVLHLLEIGMMYGETPTGDPKNLMWVHPNQHTWTTVPIVAEFMRHVSEVIYMMTLNPNTTQAYVSIPDAKEISVNRKRLRRNKKPTVEFKLITIDGKKHDPIPTIPHGTHASPRQHWRRGHWRQYKSGKTVFIDPMLVGDEKNGKIIKDYAVGLYEDRGHERGRAHHP